MDSKQKGNNFSDSQFEIFPTLNSKLFRAPEVENLHHALKIKIV